MAITLPVLRHIRTAIAALDEAADSPGRVLTLGYPDIIASPAQLEAIFGPVVSGLPLRGDSAEIIRWHNASSMPGIVDSHAFFAALGYELEIVDIAVLRGGERLIDLNDPVPPDMHRRYAIVIDGGTCEHCFNIAQAARNVAEMTAIGGYVIAVNPMSMFNHGFYNLSPTWYHDFYGSNGFAVESLRLAVLGFADQTYDIPAYSRFVKAPPNSMLVMLARRVRDCAISWPVQTKYRK